MQRAGHTARCESAMQGPKKTGRISVRVDPALLERLEALARGAERSVGYVVRRILKEWLLRESAPVTKSTRSR